MARRKLADGSRRPGNGVDTAASIRTAQPPTPAEAYPLKLTEQQRSSVLHCTRLKRAIKDLLQVK